MHAQAYAVLVYFTFCISYSPGEHELCRVVFLVLDDDTNYLQLLSLDLIWEMYSMFHLHCYYSKDTIFITLPILAIPMFLAISIRISFLHSTLLTESYSLSFSTLQR